LLSGFIAAHTARQPSRGSLSRGDLLITRNAHACIGATIFAIS
jgi:hypothetical protein